MLIRYIILVGIFASAPALAATLQDCAAEYGNLASLRDWAEKNAVPGASVSVELRGYRSNVNVRVVEKTDGGFTFAYFVDGKLVFGEYSRPQYVWVSHPTSRSQEVQLPPGWETKFEQYKQDRRDLAKYRPIQRPKELVGLETLRKSASRQIEYLEKQGVGIEPSSISAYLPSARGANTGELVSTEGSVYRITSLPPVGKKVSALMSAFTHPDMADALRRMKKLGYELTIDTTLPFSGAGGYHNSSKKIIALWPDTNWATFRHEFQHLEFEELLSMRAIVKVSGSPSKVLPKELADLVERSKVKLVNNLRSKGLPENAINETLAVTTEIESLGFRRFVFSDEMKHRDEARSYALRHQITDLLYIQNRTPEQQQMLSEAKAEVERIERFSTEARIKIGLFASSLLAIGVIRDPQDVQEVIVSKDRDKAFIRIRDENGERWVETKLEGPPASIR